MTKVKIKSDGTAPGTRVEVDGRDLTTTISEVKWHLKAGGLAEVTLKIVDVQLEVDGQMAMKFEGPGQPGVHEISGSISADTRSIPVTIDDLTPNCVNNVCCERGDCAFPSSCRLKCNCARGVWDIDLETGKCRVCDKPAQTPQLAELARG